MQASHQVERIYHGSWAVFFASEDQRQAQDHYEEAVRNNPTWTLRFITVHGSHAGSTREEAIRAAQL